MSPSFLEFFHGITELCVSASYFILAIVVFILIASIKSGWQSLWKSLKQLWNYLLSEHCWKLIIAVVLIGFILCNSLCYAIFKQDDINALYENKYYAQNYEAYLYENENADPLFCIAEITHDDGNYTITKIHYSQGTEDTEIEYDKEKEFHYITISRWDDMEFKIRINRIADNDSFYRLSLEDYDYISYESESMDDLIEDEPDSVPYYVTTQNDPLNMREYPSQDKKIVGKVPKGADIYVDSIYNNWGHTYWDGISGWVNLDYCTSGYNPDPTYISLNTMVYFTEDGNRFHKLVCPHIQGCDLIAMTVDWAYSAHNRTPCKTCLPGIDMADFY